MAKRKPARQVKLELKYERNLAAEQTFLSAMADALYKDWTANPDTKKPK